ARVTTDEEPGQREDRFAQQTGNHRARAFNKAAIRTVRTTQVAKLPVAMIHRANSITGQAAKSGESTAATVSTNIRCCLAIGPTKSCAKPSAPPVARTYAVAKARIVAPQ